MSLQIIILFSPDLCFAKLTGSLLLGLRKRLSITFKIFRLEEDGKVLSPEELLYRCVHYVNHTHDKVRA